MIFTAPAGAVTVRLVAFSEPLVLKSMPPLPELKLAVVAVKEPVALMPPTASDALSANNVPELAAI